MLVPIEFVTASIITAFIVLGIIIGLDPAGYIAFFSGYTFGYLIDGFLKYIIVRKRDPKNKLSQGTPWVIYDVDGRKAFAIQNNKALFERLFFKNHVFILSKTPFGDADWYEPTKYPLFPAFKRKMMMVDSYAAVPVKWSSDYNKKKVRQRYAMIVKKAHGSMVSMDQLCFEADAVNKANESAAEAHKKYIDLLHFINTGLPMFIANFIADAFSQSPQMQFAEVTRRSEDMAKKEEDNAITILTEQEKELIFSAKEEKDNVQKEE
ncbi:MAG: hypothetical protein FWD92_00025 [Methanomassiliicoccaceae archaeon]|nr:hypothetical protein [Methanomassiliicoccaceae archaeon]